MCSYYALMTSLAKGVDSPYYSAGGKCTVLYMQATKLKHQLTYEQQRDLKADADAAKKEVEKIQENLNKLEEEARAAAEAAKSDEQELASEVHMTGHAA